MCKDIEQAGGTTLVLTNGNKLCVECYKADDELRADLKNQYWRSEPLSEAATDLDRRLRIEEGKRRQEQAQAQLTQVRKQLVRVRQELATVVGAES